MFAYQSSRVGVTTVDVAFTDRHGGISGGPYASLDLGDRAAREGELDANLARLAEAFTGDASSPLALMRQVHGRDVAVVDGVADPAPRADALVTDAPGLTLVVRAADCLPVLIADAERGLVAAAHAGRPGLVAGVVPAVVAQLRVRGARSMVAWLGPHVCGSCYEVPEAMRAEVAEVSPESFATTSWGTPAVDIAAGVTAQLLADGVEVVDLDDAARCTIEDDDLFSYRRQGAASGRLAGVIRVRP